MFWQLLLPRWLILLPLYVIGIFCLLEFCMKNTYSSFQGRFYEQTEGAAMGSPIRLIVANLFMEDLKVQAINISTTPHALWKRFVDDTLTIIKKDNRNSFLQHLNSMMMPEVFCGPLVAQVDQSVSKLMHWHD